MVTLPGLPPGPRLPLPLQTLRYGLDPYGFFESAHRAFGDVFTARAMGETWVVLAHPDAVRELYTYAPDEADSGVANMALRPLLGTRNVLLLDGQEHLRRRKLVLIECPPIPLVAHAAAGGRLSAVADVIRRCASQSGAASGVRTRSLLSRATREFGVDTYDSVSSRASRCGCVGPRSRARAEP